MREATRGAGSGNAIRRASSWKEVMEMSLDLEDAEFAFEWWEAASSALLCSVVVREE